MLIIKRSKFYYTAPGIITPVGGRPVRRLREELIRLSWAGHMKRLEESDPAKKAFCTKPGGNGHRIRDRTNLR